MDCGASTQDCPIRESAEIGGTAACTCGATLSKENTDLVKPCRSMQSELGATVHLGRVAEPREGKEQSKTICTHKAAPPKERVELISG